MGSRSIDCGAHWIMQWRPYLPSATEKCRLRMFQITISWRNAMECSTSYREMMNLSRLSRIGGKSQILHGQPTNQIWKDTSSEWFIMIYINIERAKVLIGHICWVVKSWIVPSEKNQSWKRLQKHTQREFTDNLYAFLLLNWSNNPFLF